MCGLDDRQRTASYQQRHHKIISDADAEQFFYLVKVALQRAEVYGTSIQLFHTMCHVAFQFFTRNALSGFLQLINNNQHTLQAFQFPAHTLARLMIMEAKIKRPDDKTCRPAKKI